LRHCHAITYLTILKYKVKNCQIISPKYLTDAHKTHRAWTT
jgi:threonine dehydrogenase-like Zn-dependent dehydrogenase